MAARKMDSVQALAPAITLVRKEKIERTCL